MVDGQEKFDQHAFGIAFAVHPVKVDVLPDSLQMPPWNSQHAKFFGKNILSDTQSVEYLFVAKQDTIRIRASGMGESFDRAFPVQKGYYEIVNENTRIFIERKSISIDTAGYGVVYME